MRTPFLLGVVLSTALLSACVSVKAPAPGSSPSLNGTDLSGDWEWRDDATVQRIVLDKNGNGTYPWQNGRIVTTAVADGRWEGIWSQEGNDREGGFKVLITPNSSEAEGTWWYTRIGARKIPAHEQGGDFRFRRLTSVVAKPSP